MKSAGLTVAPPMVGGAADPTAPSPVPMQSAVAGRVHVVVKRELTGGREDEGGVDAGGVRRGNGMVRNKVSQVERKALRRAFMDFRSDISA